ncbi:MAG: threonine--tRNA ligase [Candidatus Woesearchaeota archaeon]
MPSIVVNGKKKQYPAAVSGIELAKEMKLEGKALAMKVNGELKDLSSKIEKDAEVKLITFDDAEGKNVFWHTAAHILACAINNMYPDALNTIGPAIEDGFYYDFDNLKITVADFEKIEMKMREIITKKLPCERKEMTLDEINKIFIDNPYKRELAEEFSKDGKKLTVYTLGNEFLDLCEGPHLPDTGYVKAVKLMTIASAFWKGDQKNKQLTRIYGTAFPTQEELRKHLELLKELEQRDHRKLGKDLELFTFHEWSPGSPFLLPKGTIIYNELLKFLREEYRKRGYQEVITPQLFNKALWEKSGHWEHFKENMFVMEIDGEEFSLKPMNCPSHCLIYLLKNHSYRELPLRIADFCFIHRNELRGVLGGMTRVRKMSQDDAHIYCAPEQIQSEIKNLLEFVKYIYHDIFRMEYHAKLSTKPEKAMGSPKQWEQAEEALKKALDDAKIKYVLKPGEGAFYGPKIDFDVKDALGRDWQCATIQLDFQMPQRFDLKYMAPDNTLKTPVMIHRAILGTLERFIGVITEHFAGKFPLWLSPVQARIVPVSDKFLDYARSIYAEFFKAGIRIEIDESVETLNKKIRNAELDKVNYILVVGGKEQENKTINVRTRDNKVEGEKKPEEFIERMKKEIAEKK